MGTSKGYEPPKGGDWNSLKRQIGDLLEEPEKKKNKVVSKFAKAIGGSEKFPSASRPTSVSIGGGKSTSFKSSSARKTVKDVISLFGDINKNGLNEAIDSREIDLKDKSIDEVKESLIDYFLLPATDPDSVCSSLAVESVIETLFEDISDESNLEEFLASVITSDRAKQLVCGFYENYIYELFARTFFEDRTKHTNQSDATEILEIVKETIHEKIATFECSNNIENIDFNAQEGSDFVQGVLKEIIEVLEGEEDV